MVIVAVCNTADRTGKTTSVIQLGAALGLSGQRTLLLDLDPDAWLSKRMGAFTVPASESSYALFELDVNMGALPVRQYDGFDVLPACTQLRTRAQTLTKPTDVFWVKEALASLTGYDFVLIDTAGGFRTFILNAMVAARTLLIPLSPGIHAIKSAEQTWQMAREVRTKLNPDLRTAQFLCTFAQPGTEDGSLARIREQYEAQVLDSVVRSSKILSLDMEIIGRTVFDINVRARGALDYANVADELIRRLDGQSQGSV
ncbi:MAG: ParA family protein [Bacteroidota bacterium]|nr:ParA family protein [Bacteroidota bacterium]MDE2835532.1 ParA family protein [Bacteroidota bacterium]MDE2957007.1 ParA family protein [Bacteroidota bacterium]